MKNVLSFLGLMTIAVSVFADCTGGSCVSVKVQSMQVSSDGIIYIQTSGNELSLNCQPEASVFLKLKANTDGGKNIYSALLSAQARDKFVDIRIVDNVSPCEVTYINAL